MRFAPLLALLPALVAAQEQVAFTDQVMGWFDQVKSFIPQAPATPETAQQVIQKPTTKSSDKASTEITAFNLNNWKDLLEPSTESEEWLIFITGGNKTCFGRCLRAEHAFNDSLALFAADPTTPNLGYLDCEKNAILCAVWAASAPTVWHVDVPQAKLGEARPETDLRVVYLNYTTVTPEAVYNVHAEKQYEQQPRYEGWLHPFDSFLGQTGLNVPLGYIIYGFGVIPSWATMIGISFLSRNVMGRRAANPGQLAGRH